MGDAPTHPSKQKTTVTAFETSGQRITSRRAGGCGCRTSQRAPDVGPEVPDESELFQEGRQRGTRGGETETARPAEGVPGREAQPAAGPERENGLPGGKDQEGIAGGRRLEPRGARIASTRQGER